MEDANRHKLWSAYEFLHSQNVQNFSLSIRPAVFLRFFVLADILLELFSILVIRFFPEKLFVFNNCLVFQSRCVIEPAQIEMGFYPPELRCLVQIRNRLGSFLQTKISLT